MREPNVRDRLILAPDFSDIRKTRDAIVELHQLVKYFKLGFGQVVSFLRDIVSLPEAEAMEHIRAMREIYKLLPNRVFLDLKFNDIDPTVYIASNAAASFNRMFNVHAMSGMKSMAEAVRAVREHAEGDGVLNTLVLAVTVLSSYEKRDCRLDFGKDISTQVLHLARNAKSIGCDGIICSGQDFMQLKESLEFEKLIFVLTGIRPSFYSMSGGHRKILELKVAIENGAHYTVMGRPVFAPEQNIFHKNRTYREAVEMIYDEMEKADKVYRGK